jgi:hypothetical protein
MRPITFLSALFLAFSASAQAGFQFEATPSAPQPVVGATVGFPSPYARPRALPVVHPAPVKPVAIGEGSNVPLRSAVLDILPPDIHPSYTDAVDPDAIISWHGGRPWDDVLREAVKPLGILVAVKANDVTLSR